MWRSLSSGHGATAARLARLAALVLLLAAGIGAVWAWRAERRIAEETVRRNAELAATYSQRVLEGLDRLLLQVDKLATPERLRDDPDGLRAELAALRLGDGHAIRLGIMAPDGSYLVTDRTATPGTEAAGPPSLEALRDEAGPLFIDRMTLPRTGEDALVLARRRAGEPFAGFVVTATRLAVFTDFFETLATEGAAASLIRRDGRLLVRRDPAQPPITIEPPSPILDVIAGTRPPLYEATAQSDGITRLYATLPVEGFPLHASFGLPTRAIWAAWGWRMLLVVASLAAVTAAALLILGERQRRRQHELDTAEIVRSREAGDRRTVLYQELNHRVKNNLQLIESLLRLHGRGQDAGSRSVLDDVARSVHAIVEVHRQLDHPTGEGPSPDDPIAGGPVTDGKIDLARLLRRLAPASATTPTGRPIDVRCKADPVELSVDQAIPLALIVVEALTNAARHAFPDDPADARDPRPSPRIDVDLQAPGPTITLAVTDNGRGLEVGGPTGQGRARGQGQGLRLMDALARQLGGSLELRRDGGTTVTVTFPRHRAAPAD